MTINRTDLYNDQVSYLPDSNILSQAQMNAISNVIIVEVGDDNIYYNQVLAKSLYRISLVNRGKFAVDEAGIKKEKLPSLEKERFENSSIRLWDNYIKTLPDIYLAFGYKGDEINRPIGIKINPGKKDIVDTCDELQRSSLIF